MIRGLLYFLFGYIFFQILKGVFQGVLNSQRNSNNSDPRDPFNVHNRQRHKQKKDGDQVIDLCPSCGDLLVAGHRCGNKKGSM